MAGVQPWHSASIAGQDANLAASFAEAEAYRAATPVLRAAELKGPPGFEQPAMTFLPDIATWSTKQQFMQACSAKELPSGVLPFAAQPLLTPAASGPESQEQAGGSQAASTAAGSSIALAMRHFAGSRTALAVMKSSRGGDRMSQCML